MDRKMLLAIGLLGAGLLPPGEAVGQIPDGWEIIEITNDPSFYDGPPDINDKGQIVFHRWAYPDLTQVEIILYDRGELIQLTDDDVKDVFPKLNNKGEIVWMRDIDADGKDDIVKWHDGELCVVSAFAFHEGAPDINDAGWITWSGNLTARSNADELFLFDGTTTIQVTQNALSDQAPRINQNGQFVATRADFSVSPLTSEIFLYDVPTGLQLTTGQGQVQGTHLNDLLQVVWASSQAGVEMWNNGITTQIVSYGGNPRVNNAGDVALSRWDTENANNGLWLIRDGKLLQISDGSFGGTVSQINNRGEVAWESASFPSYNIALLTRPEFRGDLDFDADVDLRDFAILQMCFNAELPSTEECSWADVDRDGDVDTLDYALWTEWFGGPV